MLSIRRNTIASRITVTGSLAIQLVLATVIGSALSNSALAESAQEKQEASMIIRRNGSQASIKGPAEWFTGEARIDPIQLQPESPSNVTSALVTFEPGARTNWHTHPLGQLIIVTSGKGWTCCDGGERVEIHAGDTIWCPPGHKHWHGATDTNGMSHIVVQEMLDGKNVDWLEPVTDEQYLK